MQNWLGKAKIRESLKTKRCEMGLESYVYAHIIYICVRICLERKCKDHEEQLEEENKMEKWSRRPWGEAVRDGARGWLDA